MTVQEKIILYGKIIGLCNISQLEQLVSERIKLLNMIPVEEALKIYQTQTTDRIFAPLRIKHQLALPEM